MLVHIKNNPKLTFIHIPKCGGMSINYWMRDRLTEQGRASDMLTAPGHFYIETVQKILKDNNINDMGYVMAVVRNPYDRAVSGYKYLQWRLENRMFERFTRREDGTYDAMSDSQYVQDLDDIYKGFTHYLKCARFTHDTRYEVNIQQTFFVKRMIDTNIPGKLYKLELGGWQTKLQELFGSDKSFPVVNKVQRDNNWKSYYDDEAREIVSTRYSQDLHNFGYSWDDPCMKLDRHSVDLIKKQFSPLPEQGVS